MPETNGQVHSAILGLHAQTSLHPDREPPWERSTSPCSVSGTRSGRRFPGRHSRAFSATLAATMSRPSTEETSPGPTAKTVASRPLSARRPRVLVSTPVR